MYINIQIYIHTYIQARNRHKMLITSGVIVNHCGKMNCKTADHFQLIRESLFKRYCKKTFFWSSLLFS